MSTEKHSAVLIPGDGIGPEVSTAVQRVFTAVDAPIEWSQHVAGISALEAGHDVLPDETVEAISTAGIALKGTVHYTGGRRFYLGKCTASKKAKSVCSRETCPKPQWSDDAI